MIEKILPATLLHVLYITLCIGAMMLPMASLGLAMESSHGKELSTKWRGSFVQFLGSLPTEKLVYRKVMIYVNQSFARDMVLWTYIYMDYFEESS